MKELPIRKRDACDAHQALIEHSVVPQAPIAKLVELSLENVLQSLQNYIEVLEVAEKDEI